MNKSEILICDCSSVEHQIIFTQDKEDNMIYCHIHLVSSKSFFKRFWIAARYLFGYKSKYGNFDEFILTDKHSDKLIKMGNLLKV